MSVSLPSSPGKRVHNQHDIASDRLERSASLSPRKKKKARLMSKYANAPAGSLSSSAPSTSANAMASTSTGQQKGISRTETSVDPLLLESRKQLPIWSGKEAIVDAVRKHDTVVVLGETGSGKTTQIPQYLFEAGFASLSPAQMIGVTQPRRVAATSLARRVAAEMGQADPAVLEANKAKRQRSTPAPGLVGYSIRFEDRTSKYTRIKFMTDGMVLREMIGNISNASREQASLTSNLLLRYSVLIIDEAHERTLRTDQVLGLAKRIQRHRKALRQSWLDRGSPVTEPEIRPLKIIVMSATLDADRFAKFFASKSFSLARAIGDTLEPEAVKTANQKTIVPILYVKGRQHSVSMYHTEEPVQEWTDAALRTVLQIHVSRPPGDILIFMTGQEEIDTLAKSLEVYAAQLPSWADLENKSQPLSLMIAPLYAALGPSASAKVFSTTPAQTRKVVLATNIAETSITIPGIVYVVDCGLAKEKTYTPHTSVESLQTQEISQSAARQRAGRAGRERPGECYRLYSQQAFDTLPLSSTPEIMRTDLAGAVLQLCAMNQDPYHFDWLDKPDALGLQDAVLQLVQLGAIDVKPARSKEADATPHFELSTVGQRMAMLPVAPAYARALIAATERGPKAARQVRDMIAILSADRSILSDPSDAEKREEANRAKQAFVHASGDHATLLNVLYAYMAEQDSSRRLVKLRNKETNVNDVATALEAKEQLRAWCNNHFVHEKALKNVLHIRKQLSQICRQQRIVCDDDSSLNVGQKSRSRESAHPGSSASDTDSSTEEEDEGIVRQKKLKEGLYVTRKILDNDVEARNGKEQETYEDLRKCMLEGRFNNVALRSPEGNTWKRIGGGQPFKIHPSSCLHATRVSSSSNSGKMAAIIFEELVFTTQNFGRIISRVEPAWLQDISLRTSERVKG